MLIVWLVRGIYVEGEEHKSSKFIGAHSIEVLVKQAQGCNIAAMAQGLELAR